MTRGLAKGDTGVPHAQHFPCRLICITSMVLINVIKLVKLDGSLCGQIGFEGSFFTGKLKWRIFLPLSSGVSIGSHREHHSCTKVCHSAGGFNFPLVIVFFITIVFDHSSLSSGQNTPPPTESVLSHPCNSPPKVICDLEKGCGLQLGITIAMGVTDIEDVLILLFVVILMSVIC